MHADKIVVLDQGRVVEIGRHEELLAKRGLYYHLYMAQFSHALSVHESAKAILAESEAEERREQPCGGGERLALAAA